MALRTKIHELIRKSGPTGYTTEELENRLKLPHQCVSARVTDLYKAGFIKFDGNTRNTRFGRPARVYTMAQPLNTPKPSVFTKGEVEDIQKLVERPPSPTVALRKLMMDAHPEHDAKPRFASSSDED